jgi:hypothetical protein
LPAGARELYVLQSFQTGSETHSTSFSMVTVASSPIINWLGCESELSPPSDVDVKNGGCIPPIHHVFMA